jgi:type I restriction enzyme S subunit
LARSLSSASDAFVPLIDEAGHGTRRLPTERWRQVVVALPSQGEQAAIVRFLDHADRRIRRYIRAKQKLIKLLEEQKQAIIHRAVTRGLDPDVRLKPSGVEWLGDVPEHWDVRRSKRTFTPRKELARPNDIQLSATQAYGVIPQDEYERRVGRKIVKIFRHLEKRRHVELNDFVISMRSFQGGLERAWATGCIRSSYIVLRPATRLHVGYFTYLFKSHDYIKALQATANFIRDGQDLNFANFCAVDLPCPPLEEQKAIADTLDDALSRSGMVAERARSEISLLREYRTRLIADVVTGKLDVREAAARLPDENDEPESLEEADALTNPEDRTADDPGHRARGGAAVSRNRPDAYLAPPRAEPCGGLRRRLDLPALSEAGLTIGGLAKAGGTRQRPACRRKWPGQRNLWLY